MGLDLARSEATLAQSSTIPNCFTRFDRYAITQNGNDCMAAGKEALFDLENIVQQRVGSDNLSTHGGQVAELDGVELPGSALSCSAL
jgi:hypothetical protein